jgi:hypothetical protein
MLLVLLYQSKILSQQIPHSAPIKPLPMQASFAAGINQPVTDQGLEDIQPTSALTAPQ